MIRGGDETEHSFAHDQPRRVIDVDLVNASGINGGNCPSHRVFPNALGQHFAALGQKQFGIAQAANTVVSIENNGSSYHRTEQRPAAHFIDASHHGRTRCPCPLFIAQSTTQPLEQAQLGRRGRERAHERFLDGNRQGSLNPSSLKKAPRRKWVHCGNPYSSSFPAAFSPVLPFSTSVNSHSVTITPISNVHCPVGHALLSFGHQAG